MLADGGLPMANEIRDFLAKQVIERRKRAKLSQAALSRLTNLSIARISEIERAIANPTLDTLEALAKVFNVSVVDLLDYEDSLTSTDKIKEKITDTLEKFDEKQLQAVFSMVRGIRK
jgi:transcriptional regulator with XRE-family HTH domain